MRHALALLTVPILLTSCGGDDAPKTAPTPVVDRYRVYVQVLDQMSAFRPYIARDEADKQAGRLCAFNPAGWEDYLTHTNPGHFAAVADRAIDARAFVATYCPARIPVLEEGVSAAS